MFAEMTKINDSDNRACILATASPDGADVVRAAA
jgi:hypothetical protein